MPAHHFCATEGCERAGGLDANKVACKDSSYRLDVSTWQWHTFRLSPEISSPKTQTHMWPKTRPTSIVSERGQHSANLVACSSLESGKLILFGGLQSAGINKDALFDANVAHSNTKASLLVQVDVNTFHVSEPRTTGTPPCPRHSHAAAVVDLGNNRASLLIAGGMNLFSDLLCSDLYLLELGNTWAWRNLPSLDTPSPADGLMPPGAVSGPADTGAESDGVVAGAFVGIERGMEAYTRSSLVSGRDLWDEERRVRERLEMRRKKQAACGLCLPPPGKRAPVSHSALKTLGVQQPCMP